MGKFALVLWIENREEGRISTINTSWIRDFDSSNLTKVYLTEWCEPGKKKPDEGWPLHTAKILHASDKEKELRSLEIKISRTESPHATKRKLKRSKWLESSSEDFNDELSLSAEKKTKDTFVEEANRNEAQKIISIKRKVQNKSVEKRVQCEEESNDGLSFSTEMKFQQCSNYSERLNQNGSIPAFHQAW
ncbi:hypothetical protein HHUSO_G3620 [Huso huso]|uniref:Uncharacterized protein n=1 Tax=Huso huso TaxID=61971 RepID=A0ABR1A3A2_HUSHU